MKVELSMKNLALSMAACMILGLGLSGCNQTTNTTKVADTSITSSSLKAGAGVGEIVFPSAMFATPSAIEGFDGNVLDTPHARVMVLETNSQVAIVSLESVRTDADGVALVKKIVNQYTGTPIENIYVHSTHAITTPHEPTNAALLADWMGALQTAITTAAQQAAASFQPAVAGFATGICDVNVNRNVLMSDGKFHIGLTDTTHNSNKNMTILGLQSVKTGLPIGFIMSYGVKPTLIDNAGMAAGLRELSSDVPGMAATMMEQQFGVPTLFLMGATGDQVPKYDAYRAVDYGNGNVVNNFDFSTNPGDGESWGFNYIYQQNTNYGTIMGNAAISIAKGISYSITNPTITYTNTTFSWPANTYIPGGNDPSFFAGQLNVEPVYAIRFGDAAFIGTKPEIDAATEQQLITVAAALGYSHVMHSSFVGGDAKYMPHAEAYGTTAGSTLYPVGKPSVEAQKTGFVIGAAEEYVTTANKLLNGFLGQDLLDTTPPSAIYTLSPSTPIAAPGPVIITVIAYDDISGVNSITTPDGKINQVSTVTYSVSANGPYKFILQDNAGNTATFTVTVSNIQ
jgi:hypothetical protein